MIGVIEKWKPIEGYEGLYEVSDWGDVKSLPQRLPFGRSYRITKENILVPHNQNNGYMRVGLYKDRKAKYKLVHRLVAEAFIPNPNNLPCINHKDENKENNHVDNLEWCSVAYNNTYGSHNERAAKTKTNSPKRSKRVNQYSLDGEFIREWVSIAEAGRNGFDGGTISMCCSGKYKKHKGFIWKYAEE